MRKKSSSKSRAICNSPRVTKIEDDPPYQKNPSLDGKISEIPLEPESNNLSIQQIQGLCRTMTIAISTVRQDGAPKRDVNVGLDSPHEY